MTEYSSGGAINPFYYTCMYSSSKICRFTLSSTYLSGSTGYKFSGFPTPVSSYVSLSVYVYREGREYSQTAYLTPTSAGIIAFSQFSYTGYYYTKNTFEYTIA